LLQLFQVIGPAKLTPDAVKLKRQLSQPQRSIEVPGHTDNLCIQSRVGITYGFYSKLAVLTVPPRLGSFVAKDGADIVEPHRLRKIVHAMLDISPADRCRSLRAQGHAVATPILEGIHLLLYDVCPFADAVLEQACLLENRGIDTLVAVKLTNPVSLLFYKTPVSLILG
jgi:hypothetical protein